MRWRVPMKRFISRSGTIFYLAGRRRPPRALPSANTTTGTALDERAVANEPRLGAGQAPGGVVLYMPTWRFAATSPTEREAGTC